MRKMMVCPIVQPLRQSWTDTTRTDTPVVEVVDHTSTAPNPTANMSKKELKAYLVSFPPQSFLSP